MEGRVEREMKIEKGLVEKLALYPKWLEDFYYYIGVRSAATTKKVYINYIIDFTEYCEKTLGKKMETPEDFKDIDASFMNRYVYYLMNQGDKKKGASIVNARICAVNKLFHYFMNIRAIDYNPCIGLEKPRATKKNEVVFLEPEEIENVESCVDSGVGNSLAKSRQKKWKNRDRLLIDLPLYTGIRNSAMVDINIEDINLSEGTLRVIEKRNKERVFPLANELVDEIKLWLYDREKIIKGLGGDIDALFVSIYKGQCKRLTGVAVNKIIGKYTSQIPKHITAHKLRATMATNVYNATGDLYAVSCALGHEDTKTTRRYVDDKGKGERKAATAMSEIMRSIKTS